jgi:hypothetical protein
MHVRWGSDPEMNDSAALRCIRLSSILLPQSCELVASYSMSTSIMVLVMPLVVKRRPAKTCVARVLLSVLAAAMVVQQCLGAAQALYDRLWLYAGVATDACTCLSDTWKRRPQKACDGC